MIRSHQKIMAKKLLLIILLYVPLYLCDELELQNHLQKNFSSKARPVRDGSKPVIVTFGFELIQIVDVQEEEQTIVLKLWLRLSWINEFLQWSPKEYDNITSVQVNEEDVWTPDLFAMEDIRELNSKSETKIIISNEGVQQWFYPTVVKASCQFSIASFPFDHQHCKLRYIPWTHDESKLLLKMDQRPVVSHNYVNSSLFSLQEAKGTLSSMRYDCCPNNYSQVVYTLSINRKPQYYVLHNLVPCAVQMLVILFSFLLPAKYGQRISLLITILLVFAVYLKVLQDSLPKTSGSTPALSLFFMVCMAVTVMAFIFTCGVISLYSKGTEPVPEQVPLWVRNLFIRCIGRVVCKQQVDTAYQNMFPDDSNKEDWIEKLLPDQKVVIESAIQQKKVDPLKQKKSVHSLGTMRASVDSGCRKVEAENEWFILAKILDRLSFFLILVAFLFSWMLLLLPIYMEMH